MNAAVLALVGVLGMGGWAAVASHREDAWDRHIRDTFRAHR